MAESLDWILTEVASQPVFGFQVGYLHLPTTEVLIQFNTLTFLFAKKTEIICYKGGTYRVIGSRFWHFLT